MGWQALALALVSAALVGPMSNARLFDALSGLRTYARLGIFLLPLASAVALLGKLSTGDGIFSDLGPNTVVDFSSADESKER